ncbi:MAG: glycerate kinase [Deltaproteobacteria bacterium]|nr:glycerate kinase [Deltaproteobacteria bacterium]
MGPARQREFLELLLRDAVAAADPLAVVPPHLPDRPAGGRGRVVAIGAGKAAAGMARAVAAEWPGVSGIVVVPHGGGPAGGAVGAIRVVEAGHPIPDEGSVLGAREVLRAVAGLGPDDLVVCLLSGGGSALLALPAPGVSLADKQAVTRELLRCGASIAEINCVRRRLSGIKGGRLAAAAAPARVVTLAISDVPGDDPGAIASGPTVPDPTTASDARAVLARYGIDEPGAGLSESPSVVPGEYRVVASARVSLDAAAMAARAAGVRPIVLSDRIEGDARAVGEALAAQALATRVTAGRPCVLLSGGETTATVRGAGRGGRNTEMALAAAIALDGAPGVWVLSADTDGIDGASGGAGAVSGPDTIGRAAALGLDARVALDESDSGAFFAALGDLIVTGPTGTNVSDFRAILVEGDR